MSDLIHLLPDSLANQIAAGEVVQRPASVVKELLENAIDAGARHIQLIVKDAGRTLIRVVDDGIGMSETDARMCVERHATSKIRSTDDLFSIRTLGFRGEAMASIAAVAQVELLTRRPSDELGTRLRVEGSAVKAQEPEACPAGTSVAVKNLFYNVPARRKFLKSNSVEMRHILDEFIRVALARPELGFSLHQNDLEVYNLFPGKLSQRIVALFGGNYREQLAPCQEETPLVKISGYIGKPEQARRTRGEQFFFVNQRYVRHPYLHHAVMEAYEELLPDDTYPFYVLFLDMDPTHVDINVHPTKTEIKFDDERTLYAILQATVRRALGAYNITPSLDFDQDVNFGAFFKAATPTSFSSSPRESSREPSDSRNDWRPSPREASNLKHWEKLYESREDPDDAPEQLVTPTAIKATSAANQPVKHTGDYHAGVDQKTFQLHHSYIVAQVKSGLMLIDQQAAHERILYERYLSSLRKKEVVTQQLLFPQTVSLPAGDVALLSEMKEELAALGFDFDMLGRDSVVVRGVPADVPASQQQHLLEEFLEQFKQQTAGLKLSRHEQLARALARRAARKRGTPLSELEMRTLIDQLFACEVPGYAPDGSLTLTLFNLDKLIELFRPS
ncbi:DNA mismatch repair protein MutL [Catalinimonas alkaloidigena]|uniref:DNA mismatch repair protein MutL n=1 Tax=Catalinimonas alkaloidigena TaxID=1075417 RepID=A0A1G9DWS2_9BACT|nr:DNA mismatch repair endonuclease MutL [Catalinimonas alkaloidigena]SDK68298.1 DNA mismatch repair protein MutL [Catalinimonas alkaloidigena]